MRSRLKDTLLLVGDASSDRARLRDIFQTGYDLLEAQNVPQARMLLGQNGHCIAAVLADIPLADGEDVRELVAAGRRGMEEEIPVIVLIPPEDNGEREEYAFALGATDVVIKPYTPSGIQRRVQVIVDLFLHQWHLEKLVEEQSETIRNANQVMLDALSAIIEHRSTESGNHVPRIRRFTKILLEDVASTCPEYGLTPASIETIAAASALHDIGKISIPDAILNKPGKLSEEEFEVIKTHTIVGSQLIENLSGMGDLEYLRYAYNISLSHHERWDGGGYPYGLKGNDIPICAQVVGIADTFDSLTTQRDYRPALPYEHAINMILNGECGAFSQKLLECFKHVRKQLVELAQQYADGHSPKSDAITAPLSGPVWKSNQLNTLQLSQVKYQALLHYVNDTVLELDLDNGLYHVVYNPNPELDAVLPNAPFHQVIEGMQKRHVHPEDVDTVEEMNHVLEEEFFRQNLRRRAFRLRIFSPLQGEYQPYELVFVRVKTGNDEQRIVTAIWHRLGDWAEAGEPLPDSVYSAPALYGLISSALRCRSDRDMTIDGGVNGLYPLTGYTAEDVERLFDGKLMNLVVPEDRPILTRTVEEHQQGGVGECEYRLLRKDAEPVWVLDKSRSWVEHGQEYVYHAIRDNSRMKESQQHLQTVLDRYQSVIDQSEDIVFEWDLDGDTVTCSAKWEEQFGYMPISEQFSVQTARASHFHPDDLDMLWETVAALKKGARHASVEVRIADSEGKYIWSRIRAATQEDQYGRVVRLIGVISNIDMLKRTTMALKEQAERDALTKLLNKDSARRCITEYLAQREPSSVAALMILDLDNFKSVNDNCGHLYGDTVLAKVGENLRRLFRAHDVIGRIGGDEFLILLRDIPNQEMVHSRCSLMLRTFREMLGSMMPDLNVSLSIGVAMAPYHGTGYAELFQRADEALYLAKGKGKNQYKIYDPRETFGILAGDGSRATTRIDSDERPGMANDSFVRYVFRCLYESDNIEKTINDLLACIGEQLNVSRVYIFENNEDNTACDNTFEWCNRGITPEKDNLQNVSYLTDVPGWSEVFDERGVFYCADVTSLNAGYRAVIEPQGIKSMLQCAIMDGGVFRGYVGFDECTINRMWTQEQIDLLGFLAEVMALFLLKKRTQDRAVEQAESLRSVLDQQDAWIYVVDPDSCRLKFLNAKAKQLTPDSREGMTCHRVFMGRESRCEGCPSVNVQQEQSASAVLENHYFGLRVCAQASQILWNGEPACLLTCRELPKE